MVTNIVAAVSSSLFRAAVFPQKLRFTTLLLSLSLFLYACAVTGPPVTPEEEAAGRGIIQRPEYVAWWKNQKRLLRVTDRFAWNIRAPGAPYRNAFGVWPALSKGASLDEIALFTALGSPKNGTVLHVSAGSPGARAGISDGDLIVSVGGRNVADLTKEDLFHFSATGQPQTFTIVKKGDEKLTSVTIEPAQVLDVSFFAIRSPIVNASAGPVNGVNVVRVNYGMLNLVKSDDELAAVLGHEIIHILKNHNEKSAAIRGVGALVELGVILAGAARGVNVRDAARGVRDVTTVTDRAFSRDYEREADYLGLYLAHQAGFDINAALTYWQHIGAVTPQLTVNYLSTHPSTPERFVRIQKTIDEIEQGRSLQEAWVGDFSTTQVVYGPTRDPAINTMTAAAKPPTSEGPSADPATTSVIVRNDPRSSQPTPTVMSALPPSVVSPVEVHGGAKTYASLVQYDGPKVKSGVTLDAQFLDDGNGRGEASVSDVRGQTLRGTFLTINPGEHDWPKPKFLDRSTLNGLQIANDRPWIMATFKSSDTILECVHGETRPLGLKKGACRDNWGNRYWLYVNP